MIPMILVGCVGRWTGFLNEMLRQDLLETLCAQAQSELVGWKMIERCRVTTMAIYGQIKCILKW